MEPRTSTLSLAYADAATAARESALNAAIFDANNPLNWGPLWQSTSLPEGLLLSWRALHRQLKDDEADWSFWIEWYEALLEGRPLSWELTQRIALEVMEEEWDAGQATVAARIAEIRADFENNASSRDATPVTEPTAAQKSTVAQRVSRNREAIALSVAGLLEQLSAYREQVRGLNGLEPGYREDLLKFIDDLSGKLNEVLELLPSEQVALEPEEGGAFIRWLREYRTLVPGVAKRYVEPENVVEATFPVGVILGCTAVGTMIGGPGGALAGGVVGSLISNQMKPGQAAKALLERPPEDIGAEQN